MEREKHKYWHWHQISNLPQHHELHSVQVNIVHFSILEDICQKSMYLTLKYMLILKLLQI